MVVPGVPGTVISSNGELQSIVTVGAEPDPVVVSTIVSVVVAVEVEVVVVVRKEIAIHLFFFRY